MSGLYGNKSFLYKRMLLDLSSLALHKNLI